MSAKDDGGPAYPSQTPLYRASKDGMEIERIQDGMSLRDFFAAHAVTGLLIQSPGGWDTYPKGLAECAYTIADCMLKSRKR